MTRASRNADCLSRLIALAPAPERRQALRLMKPKSVFLAENTNLEIEQFLQRHHTLYIPVGASEQHGPHSAIGTDVFIPQEIARRVCVRQGDALVAPPLPYTLSYPHRGFTSEFSLSIETFMAVVRDLAL